MVEVQAQKPCGIPVEGNLVVVSHTCDDRVYVLHGVAKYEFIVYVDDDVCGFCGGCPIGEAVVECGHLVSFGEQGGLVVLIEEAAGIWQIIELIAVESTQNMY